MPCVECHWDLSGRGLNTVFLNCFVSKFGHFKKSAISLNICTSTVIDKQKVVSSCPTAHGRSWWKNEPNCPENHVSHWQHAKKINPSGVLCQIFNILARPDHRPGGDRTRDKCTTPFNCLSPDIWRLFENWRSLFKQFLLLPWLEKKSFVLLTEVAQGRGGGEKMNGILWKLRIVWGKQKHFWVSLFNAIIIG